MTEVLKILLATGRLLHCPQVLETAHLNHGVPEGHRNGRGREIVVSELRVHPCRLLEDAQWAAAGFQSEVGSFGKLSGIGWIVGMPKGRKVSEADMLRLDLNEHASQPRQVLRGGIGNDVQILGGPYEAVH